MIDQITKGLKGDRSLRVLIYTNLLFIVFALIQQWSFFNVLIGYWVQSVIIGIVNFVRILRLKQFTTEGFTTNGVQPPVTDATKKSTALFFLVHYGFFHVAYAFFIFLNENNSTPIDWVGLGAVSLFFLINHFSSYWYHYEAESAQMQNIGKVMFKPYARILPMHFIIILGFTLLQDTSAYEPVVLVMFLVLKTIADIAGHYFEHLPVIALVKES